MQTLLGTAGSLTSLLCMGHLLAFSIIHIISVSNYKLACSCFQHMQFKFSKSVKITPNSFFFQNIKIDKKKLKIPSFLPIPFLLKNSKISIIDTHIDFLLDLLTFYIRHTFCYYFVSIKCALLFVMIRTDRR
jgi:hypothetical protein